MKLVEKLLKVQSVLKAPKNQRNTFGNYNYRSCEDILEAVKPLLAEHGLLLTIKDEILFIGERFYVKATATITDGTDMIENSALAREEETKKGMDSSQITGTASSYARKYCLNGLFLIDDTKDADTDENRTERENRAKKQEQKKEEKKAEKPSYTKQGNKILLLDSKGGFTPLTDIPLQALKFILNKPQYAGIKADIENEIAVKECDEAMDK